jgi:3-methyladenine DNA glycosylase AlkC
MGGLLKDLYSPAFYKQLTRALSVVIPTFNRQRFTSRIFTDDFQDKELKARMRHTTQVMQNFMPSDFKKSVGILQELIRELEKNGIGEDGLAYMFIPDYIEVYGLDDFETSVKAIESITRFVSCEFAVRPFLLKYGERMMHQMLVWSKHEHFKVRRLASEGSRPRLPWAMAVPALKKDPSPILPILENLKRDPSEWVRRSVANNLNDIAKDHPDQVIALARNWRGISKETDAIIKHGSRTLLKKGHADILHHYGLKSKNIAVTAFKIGTPSVTIGESLEFSFRLSSQDRKKQTIRLEYGLYYRKSNHQLTKKVFKISEKIYEPGSVTNINRKQSFRKITTRVFYPGEHRLSIIVNGEEKVVKRFKVIVNSVKREI